MRIELLCKPHAPQRCQRALDNIHAAIEQAHIQAQVHVSYDRRKMIDNRVYVTPALLVDDDVRIAGRVPELDELLEIIYERPRPKMWSQVA